MRLLLADDHVLVRGGLRAVIAAMPEVSEIFEASDGHEAVAAVALHSPDIVLMDIAMPRLGGLEALSQIRQIAPATRVIMVSMHQDEAYVRRALRAGAAGYLTKSALVTDLREALCAARRGEVFVSRGLREAELSDPRRLLTPRQREVLQLIAAGMTTRGIAERLNVGFKTIESHRMHLMRRLDIHDVAGLVRYAVHNGLVQDCD
jgi:DNA-binding NarL/FixJ family response regulator